jgi:hypothetical protein
MNLPVTRKQLAGAVVAAFPMASAPPEISRARVGEIVAERFGNDGWNFEFA